jgi:hypothetical protein
MSVEVSVLVKVIAIDDVEEVAVECLALEVDFSIWMGAEDDHD